MDSTFSMSPYTTVHTPNTSMMIRKAILTTVYACGHTFTEPLIRYLKDGGEHIFINSICTKASTCKKRRPNAVAKLDDRASLTATALKRLAGAEMKLVLAESTASRCLRLFATAPPVLEEEISEACGGDWTLTTILTGTSAKNRDDIVKWYLPLANARWMLNKARELMNAEGPQAHVDFCIEAARDWMQKVQANVKALEDVVGVFLPTTVDAPARPPRQTEALETYEPDWGVRELAALRSTEEGRAILAMPLNREGILAARKFMRGSKTEAEKEQEAFMAFQEADRAAYCADYPGMARRYASGEMEKLSRRWNDDEPNAYGPVSERFIIYLDDPEWERSQINENSGSESEYFSAPSFASIDPVTAPQSPDNVDNIAEAIEMLDLGKGIEGRSIWHASADLGAGCPKRSIQNLRPTTQVKSRKMESMRARKVLSVDSQKKDDDSPSVLLIAVIGADEYTRSK